MTENLLALLIAGGIVPVLAAFAMWIRSRANRAKEEREEQTTAIVPADGKKPPEKTIVRVDDSDGDETTGQFIIALQKAKPDVLERLIHEMRARNAQEPATRQDVANEVAPVREDMKRHNEAYSEALTGLRNDVGDLQDDVGTLKVDVGKLKVDVAEIRGEGCGLPYGGNGGVRT